MIHPEEVIDVKEWFNIDIPRKEFRALLKRNNHKAVINFTVWFLLLFGTGYVAYLSIGHWYMIPAFMFYGVIYSSDNSRHHECSHGTVFKTKWPNEFFFWLCGSMEFRDNIDFRWSHTRHHSFTSVTPIDPEELSTRPPNIGLLLIDFVFLNSGIRNILTLISHSLGRPTKKAATYVPEEDFKAMYWWARAALAPHLVAIGLSIYLGSWLPVVFFSLPKFYGYFVQWTFIILQHVGLDHNVWDQRAVCRSFKLNPFLSFIYMNMENHIEHHMYPMVPYHALPELHEKIKDDLPEPYKGLIKPLIELVPVLKRQLKDPEYVLKRG